MDVLNYKDLIKDLENNPYGFYPEQLFIAREIEAIEKEAIYQKKIEKPFLEDEKQHLLENILRFYIKEDIIENTLYGLIETAIFEGLYKIADYREFKRELENWI